ncbi:MAG: site-specific integrase, partial [Clostridiales bacterium]|nr:site-specific integrase [Clostridiales bacterium]
MRKTNYEKNGSKYYRVSKTIDGAKKEFYGASKKEAEAKRDEYVKARSAGLAADYKGMALKDLMRLWLFEVLRAGLADATMDRYESIYRLYVLTSPLAAMKIHEIGPLAVQRYYNDLCEAGKTESVIRSLHKLLKAFFKYAIVCGYTLFNPCGKTKIPQTPAHPPSDGDGNVDPFSDEEVRIILNGAADSRPSAMDVKVLCQLALATGLRKGELLALTHRDIDLDAGTLKVSKTLKRVRKIERDGSHTYATVVKPPKTKTSARVVPIPTSVIVPLRRHIAQEKAKYLKNGLPYTNDSLIFTTQFCNNIDGTNLSHAWERLLKAVGVRYRKFHNLRHTYATKLFEQGVDIKT